MKALVSLGLTTVLAFSALAEEPLLVPAIDGDWWQVAGNPDLGELTAPDQEPVDFAIWQVDDGTWQLQSCIRKTKEGGRGRVFYRWEGARLTDRDWKPSGIANVLAAQSGIIELLLMPVAMRPMFSE